MARLSSVEIKRRAADFRRWRARRRWADEADLCEVLAAEPRGIGPIITESRVRQSDAWSRRREFGVDVSVRLRKTTRV